MKKKIILLTFILFSGYTFSQVGVNTENPKTTLHVVPTKSDATTAEGIIAPNLTRAQLISKDSKYIADQQGAIVYVTDTSGTLTTKTANITAAGYYYFDGSVWQALKGASGTGTQIWNKIGTSSASTLNTDNSYLNAQVVVGGSTAASVNGGTNNAQFTVTGGDAVINGITLGRGKGQKENSLAVGINALANNTTGSYNTAVGAYALQDNTSGFWNTSVGYSSLAKLIGNSTENAALGYEALTSLTTGNYNTAIGSKALISLASGEGNVVIGTNAAAQATSGNNNIVIGRQTAQSLSTGSYNIMIGSFLDPVNGASDKQINIGNALFGTATQTNETTDFGQISIGKRIPDSNVSLDVNGKTQLNDLRYANGTQGAGKILTSDASGNATWVSGDVLQTPLSFTASGSVSSNIISKGMNTSIKVTLPAKSKWLIYLGLTFSVNNGTVLQIRDNKPDWVWIRLTWSDSATGATSSDVIQGKLVSTALTPGPTWSFASGVSLIENTSSNAKTYYLTTENVDSYVNGVYSSANSIISLFNPFGYFSENYLFGVPLNK